MIRVCPHSDAACAHGMACQFSCATDAYDGTKRPSPEPKPMTANYEVEALKPCPFCNGAAVATNFIIEASVRCAGCGTTITRRHSPRVDNGLPQAIASWNTRAEERVSPNRAGVEESETWPRTGPDFNRWNDDAAAFVRLVQDNPGFWLADFSVKYLGLRIDTRSGHFVLKDRDGAVIQPERVLAAIEKSAELRIRPSPAPEPAAVEEGNMAAVAESTDAPAFGAAEDGLRKSEGEEFLEFKEALSDLRSLRQEHRDLNGGGPGWMGRWLAAWVKADDPFANEDEAAWVRQQEDAHG